MNGELIEIPPWALAGNLIINRADNAGSRLSETTHISSQEEFILLDEEWIDSEYRPKYWVRTMQSRLNGSIFKFPQESFTCGLCPEPIQTGWHRSDTDYRINVSTERCQSCNVRYKRWQRVSRAFKWLSGKCEELDVRPKFVTLTETLRTSPSPFTLEQIEEDRFRMKEMFRRTRASQSWPSRFAGIWVYEAKIRSPGDDIMSRWPDENGERPVLRTATEFELHGHIHACVATRWIDREPLLERHEGVHVKASTVDHMKKYLMGYMLVDTVGRYARFYSKMDQPFDLGQAE